MDVNVILHPTDGSASSQKALDLACDLARDRGARLIVVHVQRRHGLDMVPEALARYERVEHLRMTESDLHRATAQSIANAAEQEARARGLTAVESMVVEGDPSREIVGAAKTTGADLIVMGSRGLGDLQGLLLGSVSHKVSHAAPCSCLVVR